jgi:hypothetical protein
MTKLFDYLEECGVEEEGLPQELQAQINALDARTKKFNEDSEDYDESDDEDEETEAALAAEDARLDAIEDGIINAVYAYLMAQSGNQVKPVAAKPAGNNDGDDWGTLLIGGVLLALTFGAVNIYKNR